MIHPKVLELLNQQVNKEFYSAYLYLDIANYYQTLNLDGFANWFMVQAREEQDHALLIYRYLHNNNVQVSLSAIAKPDKVFADAISPLRISLEHEKYVTSLIDAIYSAADEAKDFRTMQVVEWFIREQGEEEKNAFDLIAKMELFGCDPQGLYLLNAELGGRKYKAPSLEV